MRRALSLIGAAIFISTMTAQPSHAQDATAKLTEEEAHAIGVDAYVYLCPLVTMDITRAQLTNSDKGFGRGPINAFHNVWRSPSTITPLCTL